MRIVYLFLMIFIAIITTLVVWTGINWMAQDAQVAQCKKPMNQMSDSQWAHCLEVVK